MSFNNVSVTGIVANIPELKFAPSGVAYLALSVPDKKSKRNDQGGYDDLSATTWFRATVFGQVAEMLAEKVNKFDEVTVTGRLITREYEKDGQTHQSLEVDNARVAWHGPKKDRQQSGGQSGGQQSGGWGGPPQAAQSDPWAPQQVSAPGQTAQAWNGANDEPPF